MSSFDCASSSKIAPSPWVLRYAPLVRAGTTVLDVACGHGRHSRVFSETGHPVVAADISTGGMPELKCGGDVDVREIDLETGPWPFERDAFGAIVVTNYLHRPHFPHYVASLAEGGVLLIDTFGAGNEKLGRPRNPDFLLAPGELLTEFSDKLEIVAYEHGSEDCPRPAVRQRLCAVKAAGPHPLNNPNPFSN